MVATVCAPGGRCDVLGCAPGVRCGHGSGVHAHGGSRARVVDRRRAISDAVKPIDVSPPSDALSYTLCVIHAHTLYALPFRYVSDVPSSPSLPLSARPVTVRCGLLWGIYAPAFALNAQCVGSIPSDTTPLMANRQVSSLWVTFPLSLIGLYS